jgi:hypothetical protein
MAPGRQRPGRHSGRPLRRLGRGEVELTHEAFHGLQRWRTGDHVRELLVACGALPAIDKQVWLFERWLPGRLAGIPDEGHAQLIRRFATWEVLPRLRSRAGRKPITTYSRRYAGEQVKIATESATGLIIAHGTWLDRADFTRFVHHGTGTAAIGWEAAVAALDAGGLPSSAGEKRTAASCDDSR